MSVDWAQFVASLREHIYGSTMAGSDEEPWAQFRQLVARSRYADQLQPVVAIIDSAYVDELSHFKAMLALIGLVSPQEWSPAMNEAREHYAGALKTLLRELDAHRHGTLANRLAGVLDPAFHDFVSMVQLGRDMLLQPCPPGQLPHVSELCNLGLRSCLDRLRTALGGISSGDEIGDARVAFLYAHSRYAEAARELNRRSGAALFRDFSPPLSR